MRLKRNGIVLTGITAGFTMTRFTVLTLFSITCFLLELKWGGVLHGVHVFSTFQVFFRIIAHLTETIYLAYKPYN
jgi:hypothetical protein